MSKEELERTLVSLGRAHVLDTMIRLAQASQEITTAASVNISPDGALNLGGMEDRYYAYLAQNRDNGIWLSDAIIDFMVYTRPLVFTEANRRPTPLILLCAHLEIIENNLKHHTRKLFNGILPQMTRTVNFPPQRDIASRRELERQLSGAQLVFHPQNASAFTNIRRSIFQRVMEEPILSDATLNAWPCVVGPGPAPSRCMLIPQNNRTSHWWTIVVLYDEMVTEYVVAYYDSLPTYLSHEEHVKECVRIVDALVADRIVDSSILATIQTYPRLTVPFQQDKKTCGFQFVDRAIAVEAEILRWPANKPMTLQNFAQLNALKPLYSTEACARSVERWMRMIKVYLEFFPQFPAHDTQTTTGEPLPYTGPIDMVESSDDVAVKK
jgi:hypothetical protein